MITCECGREITSTQAAQVMAAKRKKKPTKEFMKSIRKLRTNYGRG